MRTVAPASLDAQSRRSARSPLIGPQPGLDLLLVPGQQLARLRGQHQDRRVGPFGEAQRKRLDLDVAGGADVVGYGVDLDAAESDRVRRQAVQHAGEQAAPAQDRPPGDVEQHLRLDGDDDGQRGLFDALGLAALAVDEQQVSRVALQEHAEVGHLAVAAVPAGHDVEQVASADKTAIRPPCSHRRLISASGVASSATRRGQPGTVTASACTLAAIASALASLVSFLAASLMARFAGSSAISRRMADSAMVSRADS